MPMSDGSLLFLPHGKNHPKDAPYLLALLVAGVVVTLAAGWWFA
jgi:hypothetical protein